MYRSIPAHKQTDPAKAPGQAVNPVGQTESALLRRPKSGTLAEYIESIKAAEQAEHARVLTACALFKAASRRMVKESA
jgi:hypothetical protein